MWSCGCGQRQSSSKHVTQVVLSQEDLAETVEPSTHQSSALLSKNLAITAREKVISPSSVTPEHAPSLNSARRGT